MIATTYLLGGQHCLAIGGCTWYGARKSLLVALLGSSMHTRGNQIDAVQIEDCCPIGSPEGRIGNEYWTNCIPHPILETPPHHVGTRRLALQEYTDGRSKRHATQGSSPGRKFSRWKVTCRTSRSGRNAFYQLPCLGLSCGKQAAHHPSDWFKGIDPCIGP